MAKKINGFTLIELMISIVVVTVTLLALLMGFIACYSLNETTQNNIIATEEARRIIEQMRSISQAELSAITDIDWTAWAAANGFNNLANEQIFVNYAAINANPLNVTVTVTWQERGRGRSINLAALITQF